MDETILDELLQIAQRMQLDRDRDWEAALRNVSDASLQQVQLLLANTLRTGGEKVKKICGADFEVFNELVKAGKSKLQTRQAMNRRTIAKISSYNTEGVNLKDAIVKSAADCHTSIDRNVAAIRHAVEEIRVSITQAFPRTTDEGFPFAGAGGSPSQSSKHVDPDDRITEWLEEGGTSPPLIAEEKPTGADSGAKDKTGGSAGKKFPGPEVDTVTLADDEERERKRGKEKPKKKKRN